MMKLQSISTEEDLNEAFGQPRAILFKNSLMCGISRHARGELESFAKETVKDVAIYMVDVIKDRHLSDMIAERTGIRHESPQAFYLEKGRVIWHASHFSITKEEMERVIG